uniref:Uncharacterized protein n=1 Tax=Rhizophora mucronata TaxID=61149 RepID=A0A2P2QSY5_RHIMU
MLLIKHLALFKVLNCGLRSDIAIAINAVQL